MALDRQLFYDPRFRRLPADVQRGFVSKHDPEFGKLKPEHQDRLIREAGRIFSPELDEPLGEAPKVAHRVPDWVPNIGGYGGGNRLVSPRDAIRGLPDLAKRAKRAFGEKVEGLDPELAKRALAAPFIGSAAGTAAGFAEAGAGTIDALSDTEWDPVRSEPSQKERDAALAAGLGPRDLRRVEVPGYAIGGHVAKQIYDVTVPRTLKGLTERAQEAGLLPEGSPVGASKRKLEGWAKQLRQIESRWSQREHPELDIPGPLDEIQREVLSATGLIGGLMAGGGALGMVGRAARIPGLQHAVLPAYEGFGARGRDEDTGGQLKAAAHGLGIVGGLKAISKLRSPLERTAFGAALFGGQAVKGVAEGHVPWEEAVGKLLVGGYFGWQGGINPRADQLDAATLEAINRLRPKAPPEVERTENIKVTAEGEPVPTGKPTEGVYEPPPPVEPGPVRPPELPPGPEKPPTAPPELPPEAPAPAPPPEVPAPAPKPPPGPVQIPQEPKGKGFEHVGPRSYEPGVPPELAPGPDGIGPAVEYGTEHTIRLATGEDVRAVYVATEMEAGLSSHDPLNAFQPNPGYQPEYQGKNYADKTQDYANEVLTHASDEGSNPYKPELIFHPDPTAIGGPPVMLPTGEITSGNGRDQTVQLRYANHPERTKAEIVGSASKFGLDPAQVAKYERPMIRRLQMERIPQNADEARALSDLMNEGLTAPAQGAEKAAALASRMSDRSFEALDAAIMRGNPDATLKDLLIRDKGLAAALIEDKVILPNTKSQFIDADGHFTSKGRELVEEIVYSGIVPTERMRNMVPSSLKNRLLRIAPAVLSAKRFDRDRIDALIDGAIQSELGRRAQTDKDRTLDRFLNQEFMPGMEAYPALSDPYVAAILRTFAPDIEGKRTIGGMTPTKAKELWVRFASGLAERDSGQTGLFGEPGETIDFDTAFRRAFMPGEPAAPVGPAGEPLPEGSTVRPPPETPIPDDPPQPGGFDPVPGSGPRSYPPGDVPEWRGPSMWSEVEGVHRAPEGFQRRSRLAVLELNEVVNDVPMEQIADAAFDKTGPMVVLPGGQVVDGLGTFELLRGSRGVSDVETSAEAMAQWIGGDPSEIMGRFDQPVAVEVLLEGLPETTSEVRALLNELAGESLPPSAIEETRIAPRLDEADPMGRGGPGSQYKGDPLFSEHGPNELIPRALRKKGDIMYDLAKALGISIQQGKVPRVNKPSVLGYRVRGTGELRVRRWGDIATAAHEVGHHLAEKYPAIRRMFAARRAPGGQFMLDVVAQQLKSVSYDTRLPEEGWSEFLRHWLTNKGHVQDIAPDAVAKWEEILRNNLTKQERKALYRAQVDMHRHFGQGRDRALRSLYGDPGRNPGHTAASLGDRIRETLADDFQGALLLERTVKDAPLPDGAYETLRLLRGLPEAVNGIFNFGALQWKRNKDGHPIRESEYVGESVEEILAPVARDHRMLDKFFHYLDATRAATLKAEGKEKLFPDELIEQGLSYHFLPHFEETARKLDDLSKLMLKYAAEAGTMTPRVYNLLKDKWNPIAFFRELGDANLLSSKGNGLSGFSGIAKMRGSSRNLKPPIERLMERYGRLAQAAWENDAKNEIAKLLDAPGGGLMGARVPAKSPKITVPVAKFIDEVSRALEENGFEVPEGLEDVKGMVDLVSIYWGGEKPFGDDIMTVFRQGRPVYYELYDPMLMRAVMSIRRPMLNAVSRALDKLRRFEQGAVTATPDFAGANLFRDALLSSMTTKTGAQLFTELPRGMLSVISRDPDFREAIANGGGGDMLRMNGQVDWAEAVVRRAQRHRLDPRGFIMSSPWIPAFANPKDIWRLINTPGRVIEQTPRMAEYKRARRKGASARHAAYLKREISTDFAGAGSSYTPAGKFLQFFLKSNPFANPMIQGSDKTYRNVFRDPEKKAATSIRMALFGAMALANHIDQKDDPEIRDLPDWDRFTNLHFMFDIPEEDLEWARNAFGESSITKDGRVHLRAPTVWEVGMVANMGRLVYDYLDNDKDPELKKLADGLAVLLKQNFGVGMPVVADVFYEQATGKSYFTGSPIEPRFAQGEKWERSRTTQGAAIRQFGETVLKPTNDVLETIGLEGLQQSPASVEGLMRLLLSNWSAYGLALADKYVDPNGPAMLTDDLPLIRRFLERPQKYSKTRDLFYDSLESINATYATYRSIMKDEQRSHLIPEYEAKPEVVAAPAMRRVNEHIQEFNRLIGELHRGGSPKLSPQEKALMKEHYRQEQLGLMKEGLNMAEEMGVRIERP